MIFALQMLSSLPSQSPPIPMLTTTVTQFLLLAMSFKSSPKGSKSESISMSHPTEKSLIQDALLTQSIKLSLLEQTMSDKTW